MGIKIIAENRKARFHYEIIDKLEAGVVLTGSEVKALRDGKANLGDGFATFRGTSVMLHSVHISPYSHGGYANHEPMRARKLLMNKKEIMRWLGKLKTKGLTAIPLKLYFKNGRVKCELALARGKKVHDKRETLKKKVMDREAQAAVKSRNWR